MKKIFYAIPLFALTLCLCSCTFGLVKFTSGETVEDNRPSLSGTTWVLKPGQGGNHSYTYIFDNYPLPSKGDLKGYWEFVSGTVDAMTGQRSTGRTRISYTYAPPNIVIFEPKGQSNSLAGTVEGDVMTLEGFVYIKQYKEIGR